MTNQEPEGRKGLPPGSGFGLGMAIGIAIGLALDNIAIGLAIGVAIGAGLDAAGSRRRGEIDTQDPAVRRRMLILILAIALGSILMGALVLLFMILRNG